jgi:exonuclease VII small subunit
MKRLDKLESLKYDIEDVLESLEGALEIAKECDGKISDELYLSIKNLKKVLIMIEKSS